LAEKKVLESNLRTAEQTLRAKLDEDGRESADLGTLQKQLAAELEDEREQHQKDLAERDFTVDQTRKKYQGTRLVQIVVWSLNIISLSGIGPTQ
jgi:myosin protein heavy chain